MKRVRALLGARLKKVVALRVSSGQASSTKCLHIGSKFIVSEWPRFKSRQIPDADSFAKLLKGQQVGSKRLAVAKLFRAVAAFRIQEIK